MGVEMVHDARQLMSAVGFGSGERPWLRLGVGLDVGRAYVGNVGGSGEVKDFTALGDVVSTAARLQGCAGSNQMVMTERLFERVPGAVVGAEAMNVTLKGKAKPEAIRVGDLGGRASIARLIFGVSSRSDYFEAVSAARPSHAS
jgi:adenylate cyclase